MAIPPRLDITEEQVISALADFRPGTASTAQARQSILFDQLHQLHSFIFWVTSPRHVQLHKGRHISDWTEEELVPRSFRLTLGKLNEKIGESQDHEPQIDPVMSKTHPGISKANVGYRQSNNYFKQMIDLLG